MRIRIQLFTSMRIRIRSGLEQATADPDPNQTFPSQKVGFDMKNREYLLCRWFRFAQLAKGKKFRP
jgi:hypothetical protein